MKKLKIIFSHKILRIFTWAFLGLVGIFIILLIIRFFNYFEVEKVNNQILKIHSTKLNLSDVMGDNLPIEPGLDADKTIIGIDSNNNGIRDDVEIEIFKEYPDYAKTRAVLLQYALALQMETIQPFINTVNATELLKEESRASTCLSDVLVPRKDPESSRDYSDIEKIDSFINFIENKQFNTEDRKSNRNNFLKNVRSFSDLEDSCDIDLSKLPD
jgi:hypothetical protein